MVEVLRRAQQMASASYRPFEHLLAAVVDQEVLGLQITVEDAGLVAKSDSFQQLVHEGLDGCRIQSTAVTPRVHIPLEILVHEFEDQHELVLGMYDIV